MKKQQTRIPLAELVRLCEEISREYDLPCIGEEALAGMAQPGADAPLVVWNRNGAVWADPTYAAYLLRDGMVRYVALTACHVEEVQQEARELQACGRGLPMTEHERKLWDIMGTVCSLSGGCWISSKIKTEFL